MYAVIETGGKQYRVTPGEIVNVEKLPGEVGASVEFDKVLAVVKSADQMMSGSELTNAKVKGTIAGHGRGDKVLVFKFRRKKQFKRTIGHRQDFTSVKVDEIIA